MLKFLISVALVTSALAWDPSLKIAEKGAIAHHIRHGYDYPYINIAQMMNRPVRQGFSQQASPFEAARPQSQGFREISPVEPSRGFQSQPLDPNRGFQRQRLDQNRGFQSQPIVQSTGFQSQPFDQNRGFRNSPVRQTRFFERYNPNSRPDFGTARSSSFFNRRSS